MPTLKRNAAPRRAAGLAPPHFQELAAGQRLGYLLHDLSRLRKTFMDRRLKPMNMTRSQWRALATLARHASDSMKQTDLADALTIGQVAVSGLLQRLENAGFVRRLSDPADRRARRVRITSKGMRLLDEIESIVRQMNVEMQRRVPLQRVIEAEQVLEELKQHLLSSMRD